MKITNVRTRVVEWRGKTVPLTPHSAPNRWTGGTDLVHGAQASMSTFTFHGGGRRGVHHNGHVGIGNAALSPT